MNLKDLKKYRMPEAIYLAAFELTKEDLRGKSVEEVILDYEHLEENAQKALELLMERERRVLGLILDQKMTMEEVGDEFQVPRERVRQILEKAFTKLRQPSCQQILNGTERRRKLAAEAEQERAAAVEKNWKKLAAELERQNAEYTTRMRAKFALDIKTLGLSPACERKLRKIIDVNTVGELLEKFPYDAKTNSLAGLTVAPGIGKADYQEIWSALFAAGLLIHQWTLPDFEAIKQAEQATVPNSDPAGILDMSINDLWLSIRSRNCLIRSGIETVGDFCERLGMSLGGILAMRQYDLAHRIYELKIRCLGIKSADEVAAQLQKVLKDEISLCEADPAWKQFQS